MTLERTDNGSRPGADGPGTDYGDIVRFLDDGRFDPNSLAELHRDHWRAWIADRLHGGDPYEVPDPRQGTEPSNLFLDLIPGLGKGREAAELAVCDLLEGAARGEPWPPAALADLLFMVRELRLGRCAGPVHSLLCRLSPARCGSRLTTDDPYFQALATLSDISDDPRHRVPIDADDWQRYMEPNPELYVAPCFRALSRCAPGKALRLLVRVDLTDGDAAVAVDQEMEAFFMEEAATPEAMEAIRDLAGLPHMRELLHTRLIYNGGNRGWPMS